MTYCTIDFDDYEPYTSMGSPRGNVVLHGPGGPHGTSVSLVALVDTGAEFMHLPDTTAACVGISLTSATPINVATAGGTVRMWEQMVDVDIQNQRVRIPVNFSSNPTPLIGRQALFSILKTAGFNTAEWLIHW